MAKSVSPAGSSIDQSLHNNDEVLFNPNASNGNTSNENSNNENNGSVLFSGSEHSNDTGADSEDVSNGEENNGDGNGEENNEENNGDNENGDDGAIVDIDAVEIAPTHASAELEDSFNPLLFVQLGDRVVIQSKKYGRTIGTVYYRSLEYIRVKPDGVSNTLHTFEVEQTETEELYLEEDGVTDVYIIEKRAFDSFVEQQDFRVRQIIDTFTAEGTSYKTYQVLEVDKENDAITIQDAEDPDNPHKLEFGFVGIESDEDFIVISIRSLVGEDNASAANNAPGVDVVIASSEEDAAADVEDGKEEYIEKPLAIKIISFIEITKPKVYREAESYEQYIPDNLQKIDALNDFISGIDLRMQKDPIALRSVRMLVETLFQLKQSSILYRSDGSIEGPQLSSVTTLKELIDTVPVPLGRPVLSITKKIYPSEDDEVSASDSIQFVNFEDELQQMIDNKSQLSSSTLQQATIIREWDRQRTFLKQYCSPWKPLGERVEPLWRPFTDAEFFREAAPELDGTRFESVVPGLLASHEEKAPPVLDDIPFGIERALSTTYRKSLQRSREVLIEEESATLQSYLLFPLRTANYLGMKRSSLLAVDSGRSGLPPQNMKTILQKTGGPKEPGTSKDIVLLSVSEHTLGNIPLADYLQGMSIPALGMGDTFMTLEQYGLNTMELNTAQMTVLIKKIAFYQAQLLSSLSSLREILAAQAPTEAVNNPFLEQPAFLEAIRAQPLLAEALTEYSRRNPTYAQSDIGMVNSLMQTHPTHFQIAVGGNSLLLAKATLASQRLEYIRQLRTAMLIEYQDLHRHVPPPRNKCAHVATLVSIRKLYEDSERFQELTAFVRKYQGGRDHNWINCNVCNEHLLCMHERLQIQAYLQPMEKESIDKEIVLAFSGGQFQGKYICRNCGQAIKELDFDNNLEFDDNGKPKSGRAVLVDEDAIFEEKLDLLISPPIEESKQGIAFNEEEMKCYKIIHELSTLVGIYLDTASYKGIIGRVLKYINGFDRVEVYTQKREANPKMAEYHVTIARFLIIACAMYLLVEIQTKIPSYVPRYSFLTCESPGFNGHPLDPDSTEMQGILYMACALQSFVHKHEYPWNQTGFDKIPAEKLQRGIVTLLRGFINEKIVNDNLIQSELAEKRHYLIHVLGRSLESSDDVIRDMIPASFLPEQLRAAAPLGEEPITPEVAALMPQTGALALSKLWIRQAHLLAKQTAVLIRGTPFMETTCAAEHIHQPLLYWSTAELPSMSARKLAPVKQGQFLLPNFIPREATANVTEPEKELFYRLFLKYCFQGPRVGHLHETGLTHRCIWCGFQFPGNPSVMDADTEGKASLVSQDVKTDTEEFTVLLDTIHTVNRVEALPRLIVPSMEATLQKFAAITVPPIHGWSEILMLTMQNFLRLPADADISVIAIAAGPISEVSQGSIATVQKMLPDAYRKLVKSMESLPWQNFFQVMQTYFLVPIQRMLQNFTRESLYVPIEMVESLSQDHVSKDIEPILKRDTALLEKRDAIMKFPFSVAKLRHYVAQIRAFMPYQHKIRSELIPGKQNALKYIQQILIYGPLASLLQQNELPPMMESPSPIAATNTAAIKNIVGCMMMLLDKYNREKLSFNDEEIKKLIAIRDEKERVHIVAEFDKLTEEERAMELMNKRHGIGKWAVGGTKLIYAYDKDYHDLERQKRLAAGLIDFPGHGNGDMREPEGRAMDIDGFPVFSDAEYEREGGYDNAQMASDDA